MYKSSFSSQVNLPKRQGVFESLLSRSNMHKQIMFSKSAS